MVCRILVADDSSTIQKVIRIGLAAIPNDIRPVGSFVEATKLAEPGLFDLIIADAGLPGVSTASDFMKLSERAGHLPLIVLMGSYDAVRESDLRAVGIEHIIKKPFPPGELPQLVQRLTGQSAGITNGSVRTPVAPPVPMPPSVPDANASTPFSLSDPEEPSWPPRTRQASIPMSAVPTFDLVGEETIMGVPPTPELEPARKGRPAFLDNDSTRSRGRGGPAHPMADIPAMGSPTMASGSPVAGISAAMESLVRDELPVLVDRAVERYCAEHFREIAREVLTTELRRLAEEKARYLVDQ